LDLVGSTVGAAERDRDDHDQPDDAERDPDDSNAVRP